MITVSGSRAPGDAAGEQVQHAAALVRALGDGQRDEVGGGDPLDHRVGLVGRHQRVADDVDLARLVALGPARDHRVAPAVGAQRVGDRAAPVGDAADLPAAGVLRVDRLVRAVERPEPEVDDHRLSTGSGCATISSCAGSGSPMSTSLVSRENRKATSEITRQADEERRHQPRVAAALVQQPDGDQRREAGHRRAQLARGGEARVAHAGAEQLGVERGLDGDHRRPAERRGHDQRDPHERRLARLHEREERERPQAGEDDAEQVQRAPADAVATARRRAAGCAITRTPYVTTAREHDALRHAELVGRVGDGEGRVHVGRRGVAHVRADADQHAARVALDRLGERQLDDLLAPLDLLEHRRLLDPQPHPQRDADQHEAGQERNAPAPRVERLVGQHARRAGRRACRARGRSARRSARTSRRSRAAPSARARRAASTRRRTRRRRRGPAARAARRAGSAPSMPTLSYVGSRPMAPVERPITSVVTIKRLAPADAVAEMAEDARRRAAAPRSRRRTWRRRSACPSPRPGRRTGRRTRARRPCRR